jgi:hypothetical protein
MPKMFRFSIFFLFFFTLIDLIFIELAHGANNTSHNSQYIEWMPKIIAASGESTNTRLGQTSDLLGCFFSGGHRKWGQLPKDSNGTTLETYTDNRGTVIHAKDVNGSDALQLDDVSSLYDIWFDTLFHADLAARLASKTLIISKQWDIVPTKISSNVRILPSGKLNNSQPVIFFGDVSADSNTHFVGSGEIKGLHVAKPEWWGINGINDNIAWQKAVNSLRENSKVVANGEYVFSNSVQISTSDISIEGNFKIETDTSVPAISTIIIGSKSGVYSFCKNIKISGGEFVSKAYTTGPASSIIAAISINAGQFYKSSGYTVCENITIQNCKFRGQNIQIIATGTCGLIVEKNTFISPIYKKRAHAGGYSILTQSCNNVSILSNNFLSGKGSRHAIYISHDKRKHSGDHQYQSKSITISKNIIDWSHANDGTRYPHAIVIRTISGGVVSYNTIKSIRGGIYTNNEDGDITNLNIVGNNIQGCSSEGISETAAITIANPGSYSNTFVNICNNIISFLGTKIAGIRLDGVTYFNCSENEIIYEKSKQKTRLGVLYLSNCANGNISSNILENRSKNILAIKLAGDNSNLIFSKFYLKGHFHKF